MTTTPPGMYAIRVKGRLGATALSAFPMMVPEVEGGDTVLTGSLTDRSAVFGVLAQIEALGLELLEVRWVAQASLNAVTTGGLQAVRRALAYLRYRREAVGAVVVAGRRS